MSRWCRSPWPGRSQRIHFKKIGLTQPHSTMPPIMRPFRSFDGGEMDEAMEVLTRLGARRAIPSPAALMEPASAHMHAIQSLVV
jgi:hypothetical protein